MPDTLITAYEVKRYSPAGRSYPEANICLLARQVEEDFMQKCLGKEMYDWLKSKLTPYPSGVREYDASISYDLDEVVIRHGCLFKSLTNCNRTDPAEFDNDWEVLRKFTDNCGNSLWERYLREALAFRVYEASIVYDTIHSTAGGLVVSVSDAMSATTRAATKVEIAEVTSRLRQHQEVIIDNMRRWLRSLRDNNQCAQMPLAQPLACAVGDCEGVKPNTRRIAFRY